jgi:phenylalanyl-tRNA synthetase beta chain
LFEFGKTYRLNPQSVVGDDVTVRYQEREMMSLFVTGKLGDDTWEGKSADADFFYLRNMIDNFLLKINFPMEKIQLVTDTEPRMFAQHVSYKIDEITPVHIGVLRADILRYFDLKKPVYYAEIDVAVVNALRKTAVNYTPINTYPAVRRDLALVVDKDVTYETLEKIGYKYASKLLKQVTLFDVFEGAALGDGKKSYALNFVLQSADRTLTDDEVNAAFVKIAEALKTSLAVEIREG